LQQPLLVMPSKRDFAVSAASRDCRRAAADDIFVSPQRWIFVQRMVVIGDGSGRVVGCPRRLTSWWMNPTAPACQRIHPRYCPPRSADWRAARRNPGACQAGPPPVQHLDWSQNQAARWKDYRQVLRKQRPSTKARGRKCPPWWNASRCETAQCWLTGRNGSPPLEELVDRCHSADAARKAG
jgi:hypothetical protein